MPFDDRMHAHEARPSTIRDVEPLAAQLPAVRVRPSGADENGLHLLVLAQVARERLLHAPRRRLLHIRAPSSFIGDVDVQREVIALRGRQGELGHGGEGVRRRDVDGGQGARQLRVVGEEGEVEDEEHETVLAAVVGEREGGERVPVQRGLDYGEGEAGLPLHGAQPFRRDVFRQERGDLGVQGGAEGAEGGVGAGAGGVAAI